MPAFTDNSVTPNYTLTLGNLNIATVTISDNSIATDTIYTLTLGNLNIATVTISDNSIATDTIYSVLYKSVLATAVSINSVVFNEYKGFESSRALWR